ncbi:MAG TPA: nucleotidyl transferase AbiEii/AbiGii toxin family protein [Candidatus Nanoarchaeia archaeon]|nr:nucleotidyl transferase AbiEii/AbiGii toxin family protein [Candidatus Nanoarchaeia archaeon]
MVAKINLDKYINEVRNGMNIANAQDIIRKDIMLTFILAEFQKLGLGKELIFKGGTLLSRNYLKYHRFSEDLDFVHNDSNSLRELTRNAREREVRKYLNYFVPKLKKVADALYLDFNTNRSNKRYCSMLSGKTVYTFRVYYSKEQYIKIEINFIEKTIHQPKKESIKVITDFFDSKELLFTLGLKLDKFEVLSYSIEEIIIEKYRAILTRKALAERDLFDLFLIPNSLKTDIEEVVDKIASSSLIKKELELNKLIGDNLKLLKEGSFFNSREKIEDLAIIKYSPDEFTAFKQKIQPILIDICEKFLKQKS